MVKIISCYICKTKLDINNCFQVTSKFKYLICTNCKAGNLFPKVSNNQLFNLYNNRKYFVKLSDPVKNMFIQWIYTRRIFMTPNEWVKNKFTPKKILDVGCGNGEFLEYLDKKGWDVYGIDISPQAVVITSNKIGKNRVLIGQFDKKNIHHKYDVITFWHVLEHLTNPIRYIKKSHQLLNKGGVICGEMPNFNSVNLALFRKFYLWIMVPDHQIYYHEESLKKLFQNNGFKRSEFFYPSRALLNFSYSLSRWLSFHRFSKEITNMMFILSVPVSVIFGVTASILKRGEVVRFIAYKSN